MKEDYIISIVGKQTINGEQDEIELTTMGSYITKGKSKYIIYKEYDKKNPQRKSIRSILKIEDDAIITVMWSGENKTRLMFEPGKRHLCHYNTGYGSFIMGIFTEKINVNLNQDGGTISARYTIDFNSIFDSLNELYIKVSSKENDCEGKN